MFETTVTLGNALTILALAGGFIANWVKREAGHSRMLEKEEQNSKALREAIAGIHRLNEGGSIASTREIASIKITLMEHATRLNALGSLSANMATLTERSESHTRMLDDIKQEVVDMRKKRSNP